jgi:DNA-binding CsgD family transcriptional regulator
MAPVGQAELSAGRAALDRGDWAAARSVFADLVRREDDPDALYGLARALEWEGSYGEAVRCYEQAYSGYRARGETRVPALIAGRELSFLHAAVYGNAAVAGGWLARARSLADEAGDCLEVGWVALAQALASDDPDERDAHIREAAAVAHRYGDPDLRFCARGYEGAGLVLRGRIREGMRRVDEAAAAATGGEVRDHLVIGEIYCKMLLCCELALDVRRAQQWMAVAEAFGRRSHDLWVSAICRMYYGGILTAAGRWAEAEHQLSGAVSLYEAGLRGLRSGAAARLADLRVRQGRYGEAANLLADAEFDSQAALPLARLHLARGETEAAGGVLRRSLAATAAPVLQAPALTVLAEAAAAGGDGTGARAAVDRLEVLAAETGLAHVCGLAEYAVGVVRWKAGEDGVLPHVEAALVAFTRAGLPWDAARARLLLARVLIDSRPEAALLEGRAALRGFLELGAARDADEAASLLRSLGARTGPGTRTAGVLTRRECEVLALVVEGLSNQEIAGRLFLSKRTVEHHVGSILAKLGLATRAEALAYAVRHGLP